MEKELLIYGGIDSYSATQFITELNEAKEDDIVVRITTDGGDPQYGFGMVAKFSEHPKEKKIKIDGKAYSWGTYFCCYTNDVEALNVSQFLIHRAAYPSWFENDPLLFTNIIRETVVKTNSDLRTALEAKIDVDKFQKLKKVTLDDIFSMEQRLDVFLTAAEAKKIGLISSIVDITPKKKAEIESRMRMSAKHIEVEPLIIKKPMNIAELKASHPEVYAQAVLDGVNNERDRVGSWLPYMAADAELVTSSIKEGKTISATAMSELNVKMFASASLKAIEAQNPKIVTTTEVALGTSAADAEKQADAEKTMSFRNEVRAGLGLPALK